MADNCGVVDTCLLHFCVLHFFLHLAVVLCSNYAALGVSDTLCALSVCATKAFDVIFMDIHMPKLGGLQATFTIRNSSNLNLYTPIIAFTSSGTLDEYAPLALLVLLALLALLAVGAPVLLDS